MIPCLCSFYRKRIPANIPDRWELQIHLLGAALRVAFANFSDAPWQSLEKSERCPNSSSLSLPQAAVVAVAFRVPDSPQRKTSGPSAASPVDIPTGWDPRAKQQPTGLIAYGASHRRPVRVPACDA